MSEVWIINEPTTRDRMVTENVASFLELYSKKVVRVGYETELSEEEIANIAEATTVVCVDPSVACDDWESHVRANALRVVVHNPFRELSHQLRQNSQHAKNFMSESRLGKVMNLVAGDRFQWEGDARVHGSRCWQIIDRKGSVSVAPMWMVYNAAMDCGLDYAYGWYDHSGVHGSLPGVNSAGFAEYRMEIVADFFGMERQSVRDAMLSSLELLKSRQTQTIQDVCKRSDNASAKEWLSRNVVGRYWIDFVNLTRLSPGERINMMLDDAAYWSKIGYIVKHDDTFVMKNCGSNMLLRELVVNFSLFGKVDWWEESSCDQFQFRLVDSVEVLPV